MSGKELLQTGSDFFDGDKQFVRVLSLPACCRAII